MRAQAAEEAVVELKAHLVGRVMTLDQEIFSEMNQDDHDFMRDSLLKALENANYTSELALRLAEESEHPRALEVSANAAKDVSQIVKGLKDWESTDKNKRIEQLIKLLDSIAKITNNDKGVAVQVNNNMDLAGAFKITKAEDGDTIDG